MLPPLGIDGGNVTILANNGVATCFIVGSERVKREQLQSHHSKVYTLCSGIKCILYCDVYFTVMFGQKWVGGGLLQRLSWCVKSNEAQIIQEVSYFKAQIAPLPAAVASLALERKNANLTEKTFLVSLP